MLVDRQVECNPNRVKEVEFSDRDPRRWPNLVVYARPNRKIRVASKDHCRMQTNPLLLNLNSEFSLASSHVIFRLGTPAPKLAKGESRVCGA